MRLRRVPCRDVLHRPAELGVGVVDGQVWLGGLPADAARLTPASARLLAAVLCATATRAGDPTLLDMSGQHEGGTAMYRGSAVEITAQVDISGSVTLHSAVCQEGTVELIFSGDTDFILTFSRAGFQQFRRQWPALIAKVDNSQLDPR